MVRAGRTGRQCRKLDFPGLGCAAVPAAGMRDFGYPGFAGLALPVVDNPERSERYVLTSRRQRVAGAGC